MLMPAALAFAIYPGWSRTLLTIGLFVGMDLVTAYGIEPVLFGRRTGVSSIALLLSAFFWAWIWGPVGLALAIPITVSLAVLGRHVPDLEFLAVLLGDEQVIGPEISFYQRLLARDEDGASELVQASLDELGRGGVVDRIVVPTISLSTRDLVRGRISADDQALIVTWSRDIFEHLAREKGGAEVAGPIRALGVAAHRAESELLLEMLAVELEAEHARMEVMPATSRPDRGPRPGGTGLTRRGVHRVVRSGGWPPRAQALPGDQGSLPSIDPGGLPTRRAGRRPRTRRRTAPGRGRRSGGLLAGPGASGDLAPPACVARGLLARQVRQNP